jgi:hypothetical protein
MDKCVQDRRVFAAKQGRTQQRTMFAGEVNAASDVAGEVKELLAAEWVGGG